MRWATERWPFCFSAALTLDAEADDGPDAVSLLLAVDGLWFHHRLGTWPADRASVGARRQASAIRPLREGL